MKQVFKPLGIATAVAAASTSFVNVATAQPEVANNALGDLALVPYYTVNGEWITGIHIVNTTAATQVVKFRFRRALDSADALDFNIVMSPKDVYAGFLSKNGDNDIVWSAADNTCTVPATTNGVLTMPDIYRGTDGGDDDASTGYVEIIAMAQTMDELQEIAVNAKHSGPNAKVPLTPLDCGVVRSAFFADGTPSRAGNVSSSIAWTKDGADIDANMFVDSPDEALKVSYFIRDNASGVEFGDNAVHIRGFSDEAMMTNQQFGWFSGDLDGFDFPDLDGGSPTDATRDRFNTLRAGDVLGVSQVINEWTANPANGAALDWVVTLPGQYTMLHQPGYVASLGLDNLDCVRPGLATLDPQADAATIIAGLSGTSVLPVECDFRDIPVRAEFLGGPYNREETSPENPDEELVVSPAPPGSVPVVILPNEVNVITFGGQSVLGISDQDVTIPSLGQNFGWLELAVSSASSDLRVCDWDVNGDTGVTTPMPGGIAPPAGAPSARSADELLAQQVCVPGTATGGVPMIGFAAWERNVAANPDASYGRIIAHSFVSASS